MESYGIHGLPVSSPLLSPLHGMEAQPDVSREEAMKRAEEFVGSLVWALRKGEPWEMQTGRLRMIPLNSGTGSRISLIMRLLSIIYGHLQRNKHATKRDVYYMDKATFHSQKRLEEGLRLLCSTLCVSPVSLHVVASSKGLVLGNVVFWDSMGSYVDCTAMSKGTTITPYPHLITNVRSNAQFILVVEKESVFFRLAEDGFHKRCGPCVVLTGKGYPDVATRAMLKLTSTYLGPSVPVYILVDNDPYGIEIASTYGEGSLAHGFGDESRLVTSCIRLLGIRSSDADRFHLPSNVRLLLSQADRKRALALLKRNWMNKRPGWRVEVESMIASGTTLEIEALHARSVSFLSNEYLPSKIGKDDAI